MKCKLSALVLVSFVTLKAAAIEFSVDSQNSQFAVITHKAGIASAFAHNHVIVAAPVETKLTLDDSLSSGRFKAKFSAQHLVVDDPSAQKSVFAAIRDFGFLTEEPPAISESDRKKIADNMRSSDQLDVEKFPNIEAEVVGTEKGKTQVGQRSFDELIQLAVTIRGKTVRKKIPAHFGVDGNIFNAEATGRFRFTEFGIEPYSGLFGAVKNQDEFEIFVHIKAEKQ